MLENDLADSRFLPFTNRNGLDACMQPDMLYSSVLLFVVIIEAFGRVCNCLTYLLVAL